MSIDTSGVPYPYSAFMAQVLAEHPVVRQAELLVEDVRNQLRSAWGAFDPTLTASWDQKRFSGTNYYAYADVGLKIPTPFGSDLKLGYERAAGEYFNPDRRTPEVGLITAGISIPLGQRILTDERRTALTQARALRDVGDAERITMLNALLVNAARAYGSWYEAWQRQAIAAEGVALAQFRLQAVDARVRNGDSPPVDTLEASLEVQRRDVSRREAEQSYFAATISLTAYLWDADGRPIALADSARPTLDGIGSAEFPVPDSAAVAAWLEAARRANPKLQKVDAELESAEALRRLSGQQLIPFAEATVYAISERGDAPPLFDRAEQEDNYKATLDIKSPLLFLKERGKFGSAGAKLDSKRIERDRLARDVQNAVLVAANDLTVLVTLVDLQALNVARARALRDAEQTRFANGESTLLVVNIRERLVLDESVKLAQYQGKLAAARATLAAAVGDPSSVAGIAGMR